MRLERQIVVCAALKLLNEVGLDGLTTRRLAEQLGVQSPALYWHFKNKQELIDEMARVLLSQAWQPAAPGEDWTQWLADGARRLRKNLLAHRDGARLIAGYRPSSSHGLIDPSVWFAPLLAAGFDLENALWAVLAVSRFTYGWVMDEQAAVGRPPPPFKPFDPEKGFEFGIGAIIDGLRVRLQQQELAPACIG